MSDFDVNDCAPDMTALFPAPDGEYHVQVTEAKHVPTKEGYPRFVLTIELKSGSGGTADPPELASVEEWFTFPPKSEAKKFKQVMGQLRRFCRASGRTAPTDFKEETLPAWEEFFVGAEFTMRLAASDDNSRQWNRY